MAIDMRMMARRAYFGMLKDIAERQTRLIEDARRLEIFGADAVPTNAFFHRLDTLDPLMPKDPQADLKKRRAELDHLTAEARELGRLLVADNDAQWAAVVEGMLGRKRGVQ